MIQQLFLAGLALSLAGCALAPSDKVIEVLAQDKNAACVTETSVWVNLKLDRNWGCEYPPPGFQLVPIAGTAK